MAATNFTPIQLYHSTTAAAVPVNTNLVNGELAINITDGKLYYKDNGGTVQVIATKATGTIGGSDTQVQYNSSGALAGSSNFTFNGTTATINTLNLTNALGATYGGTAQSSWTTGDLLYASGSNTLAKLGIGLNTYILTSNGSIPGWAAPSAISVNTATNLAGGAAGSVPYQSGAGATTFLSIGTANQVVTSSGSAPQWSSGLSITTLTASDAVTFSATTQNIALGTSQTSGTFTVGGSAQTGTQTVGQSTKTHTLNIGTGATESGATKTINIGTGGVSTSTTAINIGSANGTTISFAANPVLSGGTANGVVYLNASKVATSGSALTFDGTNLDLATVGAKVNFATTSSATRNYVGGAADGFSLEMVTQRGASQPLSYKQNYAVGHEWGIAGSIPMTLDASGRLLIGGTSSPASSNIRLLLQSPNASSDGGAQFAYNGGGGGGGAIFSATGSGLIFFGYTGVVGSETYTERARIDSSGTLILRQSSNAANTSVSFNTTVQNALTLDASGRLLVGVTSNTGGANLEVISNGVSAFTARSTSSGASTTVKAVRSVSSDATDFANAQYDALSHGWILSNGSQAMTLDASGNLGVGTTNPVAKLSFGNTIPSDGQTVHIFQSGSVRSGLGVVTGVYRVFTDSGSVLSFGQVSTSDGSTYTERARITSGGDFRVKGAGTAGSTDAFQISGSAPADAARLTSGGNLLVGTTSDGGYRFGAGVAPSGTFQGAFTATNGTDSDIIIGIKTNETRIFNTGSVAALTFGTTGNERARITSGGYFKASDAGTYNNAAGTYHELRNTANAISTVISCTNASFNDTVLVVTASRTTTNSTFNLIDAYNGDLSGRFIVRDSGNAVNTNGSYGTISDQRLKQDIVDAGSQWDDLKAIRFRKYRMKADVAANPDAPALLGVVAQELEQTSPGLVETTADRDAEGNDLGTTTKSVKTSVLLMKAAVALQEAMARIEKLEAEVAALKGA